MAENNNYDVPVMVGAAVIALIAVGIFIYMQPEAVAPPAPREPITTPLNVQAVEPVRVDTSGAGGQQGAAGGGAGRMGGTVSGGMGAATAGGPVGASETGGGGGGGGAGVIEAPIWEG